MRCEGAVQSASQLLGGEQVHPRRGQLQGQRNALETLADMGDIFSVARVELIAWQHQADAIDKLPKGDLAKLSVPDLLRRLVKDGKTVRVVYTRGGWLDVDTLGDVLQGSSFQ